MADDSNSKQSLGVIYLDDSEDEAYILWRLLSKIEDLDVHFSHLTQPDFVLARLMRGEADILILDHELGLEQGGLDVLRYLRDAGFEGPIVMLTNRDDAGVIEDYENAGADSYLCKRDLSVECLAGAISAARRCPSKYRPSKRA